MGACCSSDSRKRRRSWCSICLRSLIKRKWADDKVHAVEKNEFEPIVVCRRAVVLGKSTAKCQKGIKVKTGVNEAVSPQPDKLERWRHLAKEQTKSSKISRPTSVRRRRRKTHRESAMASRQEAGHGQSAICCCSVMIAPEGCGKGEDTIISTYILCTDGNCPKNPLAERGISFQRRIAEFLLSNALLPFRYATEEEEMVCEDQSGSPENDQVQCCSLLLSPYRDDNLQETFLLCSDEKCQASGECESIQRRVARSLASVVMG